MERIELVGENYSGSYETTRTACRGIIIQDGRILLTREKKTGNWMIPGGGRKEGEEDRECCRREVAEETGVLASFSPCMLEIVEYYEDCRYINRYFYGMVTGECEPHRTAEEEALKLEVKWVPVKKAKSLFSGQFWSVLRNEVRRGLYLREHTALEALVKDSTASIAAFEHVTLSISTMRGIYEYELSQKDGMAEAASFQMRYSNGKTHRELQERASCDEADVLKLMNDCDLMAWNDFNGKHPKWVQDGRMFQLTAVVNDGKQIQAQGSENFPKHYRDFAQGFTVLLRKGKDGTAQDPQ